MGAPRILSVSYNPSVLLTRNEILRRAGYMVISARDAQQAMAMLRNQQSFDVVIVGYSDADELAIQALKQMQQPVPVLFLDPMTHPKALLEALSKQFPQQEREAG